MWIEENKTKRGTSYTYIERYTDPLTGKQRRASITLPTKTRAAIKQATATLAKKIEKKTQNAVEEIAFGDLVDKFLQYKSIALRPSSVAGIRSALLVVVRHLPAGILANKLTLPLTQDAINQIQVEEYSTAHVRKMVQNFRACMRYGVRCGHLRNIDWIDDIEVQNRREDATNKPAKYMTPQQAREILDLVNERNPRMSLLFEFMLLTGVRYGEAAALRECDFDGENVEINGTISTVLRPGDAGFRTMPKTESSIRKIKLSKRAQAILRLIISENRARERWYNGYTNPDKYIFTTQRGNPIDGREANRMLRNIDSSIHITTHSFRHTHISQLLEAGVPIRTVMERVGHASMKTTMEIYAHVSAKQADTVADIIDELQA